MKLETLLQKQFILCQQQITSKKALLEQLSLLLSKKLTKDQQFQLFDAFIDREQLGSTALGHGVAIPHIRSNIFNETKFAIIQLEKAIDFGAEDHRPVDIIFALVAYENDTNEHLNLLAECSTLLIQPSIRQQLRQANNSSDIMNIIKQMTPHAETV